MILRELAVVLMVFMMTITAHAQSTASQTTPANKVASEALSADSGSISSIVNALYDVISGPPGERDWKRFHSLFIPEARLIFNGKSKDGKIVRRVMSTDDYEKAAGEHFSKEGFYERSIGNKLDQFGTVAHVFSAYETLSGSDKKPIARGINSIQLVNDGTRWWVVTILWDQEIAENNIPQKYLIDELKDK